MSSLKKKKKTWFIRFKKRIDGRDIEVCKTLKTHYKSIALQRQKLIDQKIEEDILDPFAPGFDPPFEEEKPVFYTVDETISLFLESRKRYRTKTQDYYKELLHHFSQFTELGRYRLSSVSQQAIEDYIMRDGINNVSRQSQKKGLHTWWLWCQKKGWVTNDLVKPVEIPRPEIFYVPKMLTEQELNELFKAFDKDLGQRKKAKNFSPWQTQDWFKPAMATIFYCGLRRREVGTAENIEGSGLKGINIIGDLDFIYIGKSKTSRERYIPIEKKLKDILRAYFKIRGWPAPDEYVFLNYRGQGVSGKNMYKQFKHYCELAGIPKTRTLHGMRHRRVTTWLENGWTLSEAKEMAGHTKIEMTDSIYTHLAAKNLKKKMDRMDSNKRQGEKADKSDSY